MFSVGLCCYCTIFPHSIDGAYGPFKKIVKFTQHTTFLDEVVEGVCESVFEQVLQDVIEEGDV